MPLALRLAHVAAFEPTLADRARVASAEAIRRYVSTGLVLTADEADTWRADFEADFIRASAETREELSDLLGHPLATAFRAAAIDLYCSGLSTEEVLAVLRKVA